MTRTQRSPDELGSRAVIYCRVSSAGQEDNYSLETQEQGCREYAAGRGWKVTTVYRDVHSGAELFERPQLTLLRESMRRKDFDVLLVYALDRLSRKQTHQGLVLSEAEYAGVEWDSVTEDIDNSPQGQILRAVIGGMAEMERLKIIERTQRGIRARAASGKLLAGPRPLFGYRWTDETKSRLEIDPNTAPIVERIYAEFVGGKPLRSISGGLTLDGIATPTGKRTPWGVPVISSILKNPAYAGIAAAFRYHAERKPGGRRSVRIRDADDRMALPDGTIPPLVSVQDQAAAMSRLEYNRSMAVRNNKDPESTLLRGGIVRCGYCGNPMSVKHPSARHSQATVYRCNGVYRDRWGCPAVSITSRLLDIAVWERVTEVLLNPEIIAAEVERRRTAQTSACDIEAIERRMAALDRQRQNLIRSLAMLEDEDSARLLTAELAALSAQHKQLECERAAKVSQQAEESIDTARLSSLIDWTTRAAANLSALTYAEKRMLLEALGVSVRVWKTDHEPRWELTMTPIPPDSNSSVVFRTSSGTSGTRARSSSSAGRTRPS